MRSKSCSLNVAVGNLVDALHRYQSASRDMSRSLSGLMLENRCFCRDLKRVVLAIPADGRGGPERA